MSSPITAFVILSIFFLLSSSHPINSTDSNQQSQNYDLPNFVEVHDQRQNGSQNVRLNIDGIVVMYSGPNTFLNLASLLDLGSWEVYDDLENFFTQEKPENPTVTNPQESLSNVSITQEVTTVPTTNTFENVTEEIIPVQKQHEPVARRRYQLPGLLRPFVRRPAH